MSIKLYFTLLYCQCGLFCKSLHVSLLTQPTAIWKSSCLYKYSEACRRSYLVLFYEFVSAAFIVNIPGIRVKLYGPSWSPRCTVISHVCSSTKHLDFPPIFTREPQNINAWVLNINWTTPWQIYLLVANKMLNKNQEIMVK